MAWLRVSDSAGNNPIVLAPLLTDPAELPPMDAYLWCNALAGLVMRCATSAAGYGRSYYVSDATIASYAGAQWRTVAAAAQRAGYWTPTERGWQLIDDPDHLLHIRTGEEIDWERARKADVANPNLTAPVRLRDGDGCRYCGHVVRWDDRKSARGGTYDHRIAGEPARSPEDLCVACRGCNSQRGNDPHADDVLPLRPVPREPFYGPETAAFLAKHGHVVPVTTQRPGSLPDTATRDRAHSATTRPSDPVSDRTTLTRDPVTGGTTRPSDRAASATPLPNAQLTADAASTDSADRRAPESRYPGRDGTDAGRVGSGRSGSGPRRARRGKGKRS